MASGLSRAGLLFLFPLYLSLSLSSEHHRSERKIKIKKKEKEERGRFHTGSPEPGYVCMVARFGRSGMAGCGCPHSSIP
jgi:hypothetical protein